MKVLVAKVVFTVLVSFNDMPSAPVKFDIPADNVDVSMYTFMKAMRFSDWSWTVEHHQYITTHAVHGVFKPCEALRMMLQGAPVEVMNMDTNIVLCAPPRNAHQIKAPPIIDPPLKRSCDCLEISGIPIPWCENEEERLTNAHECAQ